MKCQKCNREMVCFGITGGKHGEVVKLLECVCGYKTQSDNLQLNRELHIWLEEPRQHIENDYISTKRAIEKGESYVETLQPHFLSFKYGYRLFIHTDIDDIEGHEITLGNCIGTDKEIREAHNIEKMLFAGSFDWFSND